MIQRDHRPFNECISPFRQVIKRLEGRILLQVNHRLQCIHRSGDIEPDTFWRRTGQEALTYDPIRRVEGAGMHTYTNLSCTRVRNSNFLQAEYVEGLAVRFKTKCFHRDRLGISHGVLRWLGSLVELRLNERLKVIQSRP
jgi:hypothetical protein